MFLNDLLKVGDVVDSGFEFAFEEGVDNGVSESSRPSVGREFGSGGLFGVALRSVFHVVVLVSRDWLSAGNRHRRFPRGVIAKR